MSSARAWKCGWRLTLFAVKQELAKEGILPFPRFFASDWPLNAPTGAIFLHWLFTVALILGSKTPETYTFVTNIFTYTGNWIKCKAFPLVIDCTARADC